MPSVSSWPSNACREQVAARRLLRANGTRACLAGESSGIARRYCDSTLGNAVFLPSGGLSQRLVQAGSRAAWGSSRWSLRGFQPSWVSSALHFPASTKPSPGHLHHFLRVSLPSLSGGSRLSALLDRREAGFWCPRGGPPSKGATHLNSKGSSMRPSPSSRSLCW